jgi:hypothetical protein
MAAKEFLVGRIAEEANRRHVDLSDTERKMLYFSETYDTLPDMMEVAQRFGDECQDDDKYEAKVRKLSRQAFERDRRDVPEYVQLWKEAVKRLKGEDHYLLVMLDVPGSGISKPKVYVLLLALLVLVMGFYEVATGIFGWADRNMRFSIPGYVQLVAFLSLLALVYYLAFSDRGRKLGNWFTAQAGRILMRWL